VRTVGIAIVERSTQFGVGAMGDSHFEWPVRNWRLR
jgi:hypothetical protein